MEAGLIQKLKALESLDALSGLSSDERGLLLSKLGPQPAAPIVPEPLLHILEQLKSGGEVPAAKQLLDQLRSPSGRDAEIIEGLYVWLLHTATWNQATAVRGDEPVQWKPQKAPTLNTLYIPSKDTGIDLFMVTKVPGLKMSYTLILVQVKFGRTKINLPKAKSKKNSFAIQCIEERLDVGEETLLSTVKSAANIKNARWSCERWLIAPGGFNKNVLAKVAEYEERNLFFFDDDELWTTHGTLIKDMMGSNLGPIFSRLEQSRLGAADAGAEEEE